MKYKIYSLLIVIYFTISTSIFSQGTADHSFYSLHTVLTDGYDLVKKPAHWNLQDWLTFTAVTGVTITLNQFDDRIRKDAIKDLSVYQKPIFKAAKFYGEPWPGAALAIGFYSYGSLADKDEFKRTGFEIAEAYLYSGAVTTILKTVIGRYRPFTNNGPHSFIPFSFVNERTSFPSGHTTLATALSTVLASHVDNVFLKILIFIPPIFTASERILQDVHWTSDVFMGAAIGYFVSSYIVNKHKGLNEQKESFKMIPGIGTNGRIGFTILF